MRDTAAFREEVRAWLQENCPEGARGQVDFTAVPEEPSEDLRRWRELMIERGWTVPAWPKEYGGGGLSRMESRVLAEEMGRINARPPVMRGMGTGMLGPTLLEYGTEEQKKTSPDSHHAGRDTMVPGLQRAGRGSDLASPSTRAVEKGDHFVINGQKIWTSGAQFANRMFALVRTDPTRPSTTRSIEKRREGKSMDGWRTTGVTTRLSVSEVTQTSSSRNIATNLEEFADLAGGTVGQYDYTRLRPDRPLVIHAHDKAHMLGGYWRYTADGTLISETRGVGIRIYKGGQWGNAGGLGQVTHHDRSNSTRK